MNYPRCDNRQLEQFSISGLQLDQCKSCEGIWFAERELHAILDAGKESSFVDSLVTLDDSDGPLKPVGEILQAIMSALYAALKKLL